jgi:hypothetical protein
MHTALREMAAHDLQEHHHRLSVFLGDWNIKQHMLLKRLLEASGSAEGAASQKVSGASDASIGTGDPVEIGRIAIEVNADKRSDQADDTPQREPPPLLKSSTDVSGLSVLSSPLTPNHSFERKKHAARLHESTSRGMLIRSSTQSFGSASSSFQFLQHVVQHTAFQYVTAVVILANAVLIAAASDYSMQHPEQPSNEVMSTGELACGIYFIVEVSLRLYVDRISFFSGLDARWNTFDLILALQAFFEQLQRILFTEMQAISNLSFVRTLRLFKTIKLLRIIRLMRAFRELRLILVSLLGCAKAFVWACILVVTLNFLFGVCIMQSCAYFLADTHRRNAATEDSIKKYWFSVTTSMMTFFMVSTGGQDWEVIAEPLLEVGTFPYVAFIFFIAIFTFVVLNVISSIFFEAIMSHAHADSAYIIQEMIDKKEDYINKLQAVFDEIDEDNSGEITYKEFCLVLENPILQAFVGSMDIEIDDAKHFFRILSKGGKRSVDVQTFVDGCIKMKGMARSMDLLDLLYQHHSSSSENKEAFCYVLSELDRIATLVSAMNAKETHTTAVTQPVRASVLWERAVVEEWKQAI